MSEYERGVEDEKARIVALLDTYEITELRARWDEAVAGGFHEQVKQLVDNRKKVLANV